MSYAKIYFNDTTGQEFHERDLNISKRVEGKLLAKFWKGIKTTDWVEVNRVIRYKANASKHECDARCITAKGRVMNCECACGGKNHGKQA